MKQALQQFENIAITAQTAPVRNTGGTKTVGRPKGARNKVSKASRDVLAEYGPAVFERICKIAMGKAVDGPPDQLGRKTKRFPSEQAEMHAQKIVAERLLPALKAVEATATVNATVTEQQKPVDNRRMARAICSILARAEHEDEKNGFQGVGGPVAEDRCVTKAALISPGKKSG